MYAGSWILFREKYLGTKYMFQLKHFIQYIQVSRNGILRLTGEYCFVHIAILVKDGLPY